MRARDGMRLVGLSCAWDHVICGMRADSEMFPGEKDGGPGCSHGLTWVAAL